MSFYPGLRGKFEGGQLVFRVLLHYLIENVIFGDREDCLLGENYLIDCLKSKNLLATRKTCSNCNVTMNWQDHNDISDVHR